MQSGKLNTGSRIQTFLRCFALSFDFALSSQNLPMEALQELSMMKLLLKKKKIRLRCWFEAFDFS